MFWFLRRSTDERFRLLVVELRFCSNDYGRALLVFVLHTDYRRGAGEGERTISAGLSWLMWEWE